MCHSCRRCGQDGLPEKGGVTGTLAWVKLCISKMHGAQAMPETLKVRNLHQTHCKDCSLSTLCLPLSLESGDLDALDSIVKRGRPLKKGDFLFRQGEPFTSVFAVRSGAIRTFSLTDAGEEQITGFHLPSELVGLSGMDTETYPVSAQALESTSVCEMPFEHLEELSAQLPQLRRQLMRVMSREIRDDQQMMLLLSKKTADERIAAFLVNLSARFRARGFSANQFRLSMSRNELGNYLGLAVETVSRVFTRFQQNGLIIADGKEVCILKPIELCALAGGTAES
jgi:CRP/FNR family transcriptional regulator